jgi:hypothetical protein
MEEETVEGHDIPLRELTEEEKSKEVTPERIRNYEIDCGESFLDQHGSTFDIQIVIGFFLARYPERAAELLEIANDEYAEVMNIEHEFVPEYNEEEYVKFLQTLCDFVNLTVNTKRRINQILIQFNEHYNS